MDLEIALILSQPSYRAGQPVVGSVAIRRVLDGNDRDEDGSDADVRSSLASARLYLAGRAHLGGGRGTAKTRSRRNSKWRSAKEIAGVLKLYGQEDVSEGAGGRGDPGHACLKLASSSEAAAAAPSSSASCRVRHIDQAERLAVHSFLFPNSNYASLSKDRESESGTSSGSEKRYRDCARLDLPTPAENHVVCFYMTHVLELLHVPERSKKLELNVKRSWDGISSEGGGGGNRDRDSQNDNHAASGNGSDSNVHCEPTEIIPGKFEPLRFPDWEDIIKAWNQFDSDDDGYDDDNDEEKKCAGVDSLSRQLKENCITDGREGADEAMHEEFSIRKCDSSDEGSVAGGESSAEESEEMDSESDSVSDSYSGTSSSSTTTTSSGEPEEDLDDDSSARRRRQGADGTPKAFSEQSSYIPQINPIKACKIISASGRKHALSATPSISKKENGDQQNGKKKHQQHNNHQQQKQRLLLSFRAMLPEDLPPTISAECVKYFYSAVLAITTTDGKLYVNQCPFNVLTSRTPHPSTKFPSAKPSTATSTRVHIGDLHAMAHSDGLPAYLSPADLSPGVTPPQLTVVPHPPACHIVSRMAAMNTIGGGRDGASTTTRHKIDNGTGGLCAWMTLVGIGRGGPLVPGMRVGIHVAFPNRQDELYDDDADFGEYSGIIPCHRVCCALVGEEYALCDGVSLGTSASSAATAASSAGKKRTKTRSYVFDSTYELVEYGYTDSISLGLVLPQDTPVTVKTDLVEVVVTLKVEFTVDRSVIPRRKRVHCGIGNDSSSGGDGLGYDYEEHNQGSSNDLSVIRLDLPCEVVHYGNDHNVGGENEREEHLSSIDSLRRYWKDNESSDSGAGDSIDCSDIQHDLKMLSLRMMRYFE